MTDPHHIPRPLTEFQAWPKTPRYAPVQCRITEKIDGTNACVVIYPVDSATYACLPHEHTVWHVDGLLYSVSACSRTRFITPDSDNFGFAAWVRDRASDLVKLGPGRHYGEWYGQGIQRRYGLDHKRFALFSERTPDTLPMCCDVVPTLYHGTYTPEAVAQAHAGLMLTGSVAVPGWRTPEGIIVNYMHMGARAKITDAVAGKKGVAE